MQEGIFFELKDGSKGLQVVRKSDKHCRYLVPGGLPFLRSLGSDTGYSFCSSGAMRPPFRTWGSYH